jgi:hypothetical protein
MEAHSNHLSGMSLKVPWITILSVTTTLIVLAAIFVAMRAVGGITDNSHPRLWTALIIGRPICFVILLIVTFSTIYWIAARHKGQSIRSVTDGEWAILCVTFLLLLAVILA